MRHILPNTQLFRGIEGPDIETMLGCLGAVERPYKKGEAIMREGETTEVVGVVLSGRAVISLNDVWGHRSVLGQASPGEVFAEAYAAIPGEPLLVDVIAEEGTAVLFMDVNRVLSVCGNGCAFHARLIRNLLAVCARKSLGLSRRALHTSPKSIRGRVASYLSERVKQAGGYSVEIPYDRQQLADYLGVDRSALCNELSKMQRDGLIRYAKNRFTVSESLGLG